jgi:hypothetical protein
MGASARSVHNPTRVLRVGCVIPDGAVRQLLSHTVLNEFALPPTAVITWPDNSTEHRLVSRLEIPRSLKPMRSLLHGTSD